MNLFSKLSKSFLFFNNNISFKSDIYFSLFKVNIFNTPLSFRTFSIFTSFLLAFSIFYYSDYSNFHLNFSIVYHHHLNSYHYYHLLMNHHYYHNLILKIIFQKIFLFLSHQLQFLLKNLLNHLNLEFYYLILIYLRHFFDSIIFIINYII